MQHVAWAQCELWSGSSNLYLTQMIVALGAFVLLGSTVNLLMFPKIVIKNIANIHCKHNV